MNKSIIQEKTDRCYVCGQGGKLHMHHVFGGTANRKKSDADGMVVYLCPYHHNMGNGGIHFNKGLDLKVKQQAEKIWIATYSNAENGEKDFIKRFGRTYLD